MWVKTAVVQVQGFAGRNIIMYLHTFIGFFNVISLEIEPYDGGTFILMKLNNLGAKNCEKKYKIIHHF